MIIVLGEHGQTLASICFPLASHATLLFVPSLSPRKSSKTTPLETRSFISSPSPFLTQMSRIQVYCILATVTHGHFLYPQSTCAMGRLWCYSNPLPGVFIELIAAKTGKFFLNQLRMDYLESPMGPFESEQQDQTSTGDFVWRHERVYQSQRNSLSPREHSILLVISTMIPFALCSSSTLDAIPTPSHSSSRYIFFPLHCTLSLFRRLNLSTSSRVICVGGCESLLFFPHHLLPFSGSTTFKIFTWRRDEMVDGDRDSLLTCIIHSPSINNLS